jgi:hypothetical protein
MWKFLTDLREAQIVGRSEEEIAEIETPRGTLRVFIARGDRGPVPVLTCRNSGEASYAVFHPADLPIVVDTLTQSETFLQALPVPPEDVASRFFQFFLWPLRGRVIRQLPGIPAQTTIRIELYITEWYDERYLALRFTAYEEEAIALLDSARIDKLVDALKQAAAYFAPPRPGPWG